MDMSTLILSELCTVVAALAASRANINGLRGRVNKLERKHDALPKDYVPRNEVELALKGIESNTRHTNSMMQSLIYRGPRTLESIEAQADAIARDFTEICIAGLDGKGGLNRWEWRIPHFYLDNRKISGTPAPLVTVGVGCAIDLGEALTLHFEMAGRLATQQEIADDFARVQRGPFGWRATAYSKFTTCRLPDRAIDDLIRKRFAVFIPALRRLFPSFDGFPETVKAGCLDLIYGLGVTGLSAPHYPAFRAAVKACNWPAAALECESNAHDDAYKLRNLARQQLFLLGENA